MSQIFENYSCRYWRTGFVHEQWEKHCCWGSIEIILHILNGDYKPLQGSHIKQPGFNSERYPAGAFFFRGWNGYKRTFVGSTTFLVFHETYGEYVLLILMLTLPPSPSKKSAFSAGSWKWWEISQLDPIFESTLLFFGEEKTIFGWASY